MSTQFLVLTSEAVKVLSSCKSTDQTRSNLCGIYINPEGNLEASDGHKAVRVPIKEYTQDTENVTVRDFAGNEIIPLHVDLLKGFFVQEFNFKISQKEVMIPLYWGASPVNGDMVLTCGIAEVPKGYSDSNYTVKSTFTMFTKKNGDGITFPDFNLVWPSEGENTYIVTLGAQLLDTIVSAYAARRSDIHLGFSVKDNLSPILIDTDFGISYVAMPMRDRAGRGFDIKGLKENEKVLEDAFNAVKGDQINTEDVSQPF